MTVFQDEKAFSKKEKSVNLITIAKSVLGTVRPKKQDLPYMKCASYGDNRNLSPSGKSYRCNANLLTVSGVEGDYDAGEMPPEHAADLLAEAGIAGLVYPSASHGLPGKGNRWRVICPLSHPMAPEERTRMLARVNGVLGGVLGEESFTLSQSYMFGWVEGNAKPGVWLIDGKFLDACDHLDDGAIGGERRSAAGDRAGSESATLAEMRCDFDELRSALSHIPNNQDYHSWLHILMGIHDGTCGSDHGRALAHGWSAGDASYSREKVDEKWRSFRNGVENGITAATVFAEASKHGWRRFGPDAFDNDEEIEETPHLSEIAGLPFLTPAQCANVPPRPYVIKGLMAPGQVGSIFGEPGSCKSQLAPYLVYAVARGEPVFGLRTRQHSAFYVACEDQAGMTDRIAALRAELGEADGVHLFTTLSDLFSPGKVKGKGSADFEALRKAVKERRPGLVVIDTLAAAMPGLEENDAAGMSRVVQIGRALARYGAAVVFVHHGTKADGSTPRGHSIFNGALDFSIQVKKADLAGMVRTRIAKNRNGPADLDIAFRTEN